MRVLHITTSLSGGAGKAAVRLHEALLDQGIESHILFRIADGRPGRNAHRFQYGKSYLQKALEKIGIPTIDDRNKEKLKHATNYYEFFSFCSSGIDITETPEYKSATIINLHWIGVFFDLPSFLKKNIKPVVWSLYDLNPFSGGCHYSNGCMKFQIDCQHCPQLIGTINDQNAFLNLRLKISAFGSKKFDLTVVPPAQWLFKNSKSSVLFKDVKHEIIPHATDELIYTILDKDFCRDVFNLPRHKTILLFASENLASKRKGFSLLKGALAILRYPQVHLLVVGFDNTAVREELDQLSYEYTFTGFIRDEKLLALAYNAASAVLIPSVEDNLPLTLIDALMCGVPAISFDIGGMADHIQEGINGYKAAALTSESLAESINSFIVNERNIDRHNIRLQACNLYSKPVHAAKYISIYKML